jgi:hypothetical protein
MPTHTAPPCTRPPAGWYCTRGDGHNGPCAARVATREPSPALVAHYERVVRGVEMAVLARAPRWARLRDLDNDTRRAIAELFAEAHTIAQEANR